MTNTALDVLESNMDRMALVGDGQVAPAVILWPDEDSRWLEIVRTLDARRPVLTLGDYRPVDRTGPAYWIRSALAGQIDEVNFAGNIPVVYLPGVRRDDFRSAEDCPDRLKPLVELQYRGVFWSQPNGKDWTPYAFLKNRDRGLGVEIAADAATVEALGATVTKVFDQPVDWLERKQPITAQTIHALVQPDPQKSLLEWMNNPAAMQERLSPGEWSAFKSTCRSDYAFDPDKDGPIDAATRLARREGAWREVWLRFREAPALYPGVIEQLRKAAQPSQGTLALDEGDGGYEHRDAWPQHNEKAESELKSALHGLEKLSLDQARQTISELEEEHGVRRLWVWAETGQARLADALQYLARLGRDDRPAPQGSVDDIGEWYRETGWRVDDAALKALGCVSDYGDIAAVETAVRVLYSDWLDDTARTFQDAVANDRTGYSSPAPSDRDPGTCILFTDGLRYDLGVELKEKLVERGLEANLGSHLAALPTITSTAKPALAPVADRFSSGPGLGPATESGTEVAISHLRAALNEAGYQTLESSERGDPAKKAWTEHGNIDKHGHNFGTRLADVVDSELEQIAGRVQMLLEAGWQKVEIVTDHGFLLLPGNLTKVELKDHLVEKRKGRCARLKGHQDVGQPWMPWRWDADVRFALARGAACFEEGKPYEHGGLSPQECVVPHIVVETKVSAVEVRLDSAQWSGLRLRAEISGNAHALDVRTKPADAGTSLIGGPVEIEAGKASVIVPEPEAEGSAAVVVVLSAGGALLAQQPTIVGAR